jgi:hypothetical protein
MSTVQEIEAAIRRLNTDERAQLVRALPKLLPELDGDAAWQCIINDPTPRPALTALLDSIEVERKRNPTAFPEIKDSDFDQ